MTLRQRLAALGTERRALDEAKLAAVEGIVAETVAQALVNNYWHNAPAAFTGEAIARAVMSKLEKVTVPGL